MFFCLADEKIKLKVQLAPLKSPYLLILKTLRIFPAANACLLLRIVCISQLNVNFFPGSGTNDFRHLRREGRHKNCVFLQGGSETDNLHRQCRKGRHKNCVFLQVQGRTLSATSAGRGGCQPSRAACAPLTSCFSRSRRPGTNISLKNFAQVYIRCSFGLDQLTPLIVPEKLAIPNWCH